MSKLGVLIFFFISGTIQAQPGLPPLGLWREHLPYNSAIDVTTGDNKIYCATPYSLFSVDTRDSPSATGSIERLSRVTGLSETGISVIQYDDANKKLIIAYSNSNLDIIFRNDIYNIPDIKRNNNAGDKRIYNIYPLENNYYLSSGLGIIVISGDKYEVKDSWFIGGSGNRVKVSGFTSDTAFFYAATEEGLKKASINSSNPADYRNWDLISGSNGLSTGPCSNVLRLQNLILVQKNDSLFVKNGNNWNLFFADSGPITSVNVSGNKLQICQRLPGGAGKVTILNPDGTIFNSFTQAGILSLPRKALYQQNETWVADQFGGLSRFSGSSFQQFIPNSPEATASGEMTSFNQVLYVAAGAVNDAWNYQYNGNGFFILKEGTWTNINRYRFSQIDSLLDYITIAIDPLDETIWAGSFGGGLLHVKADQNFEIFKQNSPVGPAVGDPGSYRISGLRFDRDNNLWISNFGASQPLLVKKKDGSWKNFSVPYSLRDNALGQILVDDNNYKWIVSPMGNGLICFDHGNSIDNINDDRWKLFKAGPGDGNLPSGNVLCIAKDKSGFIWIGTSDGIAVIQCTQNVFRAPGCEAIWPIVPQGNLAGFLFKGQEVRSIAVDGADRKWVTTKNGVFLISPEGERVIYQFTEDNSPLLSSDVRKVAIDGKTGEVFFATLKGICSFRSTATDGGVKNEQVLVFPNPVPPGYNGSIAIRGLVNNAIVKITEMNGRLVFQTRALGGQVVWDGKNYKGNRISTGVYLVLVSDDEKKEKTASKIVFISR